MQLPQQCDTCTHSGSICKLLLSFLGGALLGALLLSSGATGVQCVPKVIVRDHGVETGVDGTQVAMVLERAKECTLHLQQCTSVAEVQKMRLQEVSDEHEKLLQRTYNEDCSRDFSLRMEQELAKQKSEYEQRIAHRAHAAADQISDLRDLRHKDQKLRHIQKKVEEEAAKRHQRDYTTELRAKDRRIRDLEQQLEHFAEMARLEKQQQQQQQSKSQQYLERANPRAPGAQVELPLDRMQSHDLFQTVGH